MLKKLLLGSIFLLVSLPLMALPKITIDFSLNPAGFTQTKITNDTFEHLACYVAIDGFKRKFQLRAKSNTRWIKATDKRFNYKNFSHWCDYIDLYPEYKNYTLY